MLNIKQTIRASVLYIMIIMLLAFSIPLGSVGQAESAYPSRFEDDMNDYDPFSNFVPHYGDVDCDGKVNTADVAMLLAYCAGNIKLDAQALVNADVNLDDRIDIFDVYAILNWLNRQDALPPFYVNVPDLIYMRGDANCDGKVNVSDVAAILRHLVGTQYLSPQGMINARVVDGETLSAGDAAKILRVLLGDELEL